MDRRTRAERRADAELAADHARAVARALADTLAKRPGPRPRARHVGQPLTPAERADIRARAAALPVVPVADFDADALLDELDAAT